MNFSLMALVKMLSQSDSWTDDGGNGGLVITGIMAAFYLPGILLLSKCAGESFLPLRNVKTYFPIFLSLGKFAENIYMLLHACSAFSDDGITARRYWNS